MKAQNQPRMMTVRCTGEWSSPMRVDAKMGKRSIIVDEPKSVGGTEEGPTPMDYVLGALVGCAGVTLSMVARMTGFTFTGAHFDCEGDVDLRGFMGMPGICRHFCDLRGTFTVETDESEERFRKIVAEVENRCPVFNLLHDAGVPAGAIRWERKMSED